MYNFVTSLASTADAFLWHDTVTVYLSTIGLWTAVILGVLSSLNINQVHCKNMDEYAASEQPFVDSTCSLQAGGTWLPYVISLYFVVLGAILLVWKSLGINLIARKISGLSLG